MPRDLVDLVAQRAVRLVRLDLKAHGREPVHELTDAEIIQQLRGRCDALMWVATTLIQSHSDLGRLKARWHARRMLELAGGPDPARGEYRQAYLEELAAWTMTLDTLATRRREEEPQVAQRAAEEALMAEHDADVYATALIGLAARVDALTWVTGALLRSHPRPEVVLAQWRERSADAADGGFEIANDQYRALFQEQLTLWTGTLEEEARRRR